MPTPYVTDGRGDQDSCFRSARGPGLRRLRIGRLS
jgi:hypothetical protein